jgi:SAM-dependent methyltransferase
VSDNWRSGDAYEAYVGRWSRQVAREFLRWLDAPAGVRWLDVGCGTGELCRAIVASAAPETVTGVDPSEGFLEYARSQPGDIDYRRGDAEGLPFDDGAFDATVSGLVLNFVPDPGKGAWEMLRVTRDGGTVGAYVWDYAGDMQFMRYFWDAAVDLDPAAVERDEGKRFPICAPGPLSELFAGAGDVATRAVDVPTTFESFDDFWSPFLGGTGAAPSYVASLSEDARSALRERLRERLPADADGSIKLVARAWAVKGTKLSA